MEESGDDVTPAFLHGSSKVRIGLKITVPSHFDVARFARLPRDHDP
ncbi:hypothetical protein HMPREF1318_0578 [Actinomyces massiliensis F0489]|uniref:Uncharacterized protein n=1 Tax=Actinomyces massiliensis F0489 TaxID=1125718 RepID=J0N2X7_9ACTO|nr:hypothetical protein HMPREF1318_0578 [Actinomyces massiliensis F0489]